MLCCARIASICGLDPWTTTRWMPRLCSRFRSWTMPRKVSSATTSPPNAMTNVLPRNAWMYGAAERIHWTNARVVADWAAGTALGLAGIEVRAAGGRSVEADVNRKIIAPAISDAGERGTTPRGGTYNPHTRLAR